MRSRIVKKVGIIQPNYIPWRGYFDFIQEVDVFVFLDDVQYTVRDWRNRNRVKTHEGTSTWLTVPVLGGRSQLIRDAKIDNTKEWRDKHLRTLRYNYGQTPFFQQYFPLLEAIYDQRIEFLSDFDIAIIRLVAKWLSIETEFLVSSTLSTKGIKEDKLLEIVRRLGADYYLSGPAAKAYIRPELWAQAGVDLAFKDYSGYPEYRQISEPFEPSVTMLDLIFMTGPEAPEYIWGKFRQRRSLG